MIPTRGAVPQRPHPSKPPELHLEKPRFVVHQRFLALHGRPPKKGSRSPECSGDDPDAPQVPLTTSLCYAAFVLLTTVLALTVGDPRAAIAKPAECQDKGLCCCTPRTELWLAACREPLTQKNREGEAIHPKNWGSKETRTVKAGEHSGALQNNSRFGYFIGRRRLRHGE
ncbi:hypothetical protein MRX96_051603 [Rhipicephalus microplus]